jgi:two-component system sensor histidine kinase UhpB
VVYRVVQESLSNVARHGRASQVGVEIATNGEATTVAVTDDGCGFDPELVAPGLGLSGMRERAVLAGARLEVRSEPGQGTTIELRFGRDEA